MGNRAGSSPVTRTKNPKHALSDFSFVPIGTTSFAWYTQYHFELSENIVDACGTNERYYAYGVNEVLRNDVGLRPTRLRFAQAEVFSGKERRKNTRGRKEVRL